MLLSQRYGRIYQGCRRRCRQTQGVRPKTQKLHQPLKSPEPARQKALCDLIGDIFHFCLLKGSLNLVEGPAVLRGYYNWLTSPLRKYCRLLDPHLSG